MRLGKATPLHYALSLIGISAAYFGADLLISRHPITGIALTLIGASWSAVTVTTLPRIRLWNSDLTAIIRFWLLVMLFGGTLAFLVQKYYDEQNRQLSLATGLPPAPWCPAPFWCE
jgi:uncharacterized membrane protein YdbT with pleckstrin-like domain